MSIRYKKWRIRVRHVVERVGALALVACFFLVSSAWPDIGVRSYCAGVHIVSSVSVCRNRARTFGCSPMWRYASCCWRTCRCNTIPREFVETTTSERIRGIPSGETSPGRGGGQAADQPPTHRHPSFLVRAVPDLVSLGLSRSVTRKCSPNPVEPVHPWKPA